MNRILQRKGIDVTGTDGDDPAADQEPLLAACTAHSMLGTVALGQARGQPLETQKALVVPADLQRNARGVGICDGFNIEARVRISAGDRRGLERLLRYMFRPAIAQNRLSHAADGKVEYRLKKRFKDGSRIVRFEDLDFLSKLTAIIPRPKFNEVRYHGLLAPASKNRDAVILTPDSERTPRQLSLFASRRQRRAQARGGDDYVPFAELANTHSRHRHDDLPMLQARHHAFCGGDH